MNSETTPAVNSPIVGRQFKCTTRPGYIHIKVWDTATIADSEAATKAVLALARGTGLSGLMVNVEELEWVNSLPLRRRMVELFRESMVVLDRVALVANRPAIIYLISIIARASGIKVGSFKSEDVAAQWLRGRSR